MVSSSSWTLWPEQCENSCEKKRDFVFFLEEERLFKIFLFIYLAALGVRRGSQDLVLHRGGS